MTDQELNMLYALSGVILLIYLITFFVMAYNISKIASGSKLSLEDWKELWQKEKALGRKAIAKDALLEALWIRYKTTVDNLTNADQRGESLEKLKEIWEPRLNELDEKWPEGLV